MRTGLRRLLPWLCGLLGSSSAIALSLAGCGGEDLPGGMSDPAGGSGGEGGCGGGQDAGPCNDGDVRECHITIGEHDGILTCYVGKQACSAGVWGECKDGIQTNKPGIGTDA